MTVDNPAARTIVELTEVGVRQFRLRFTGADSYKGPIQVRAYGRLVGYWFPPGSLPAAVAPRYPSNGDDRYRDDDPDLPRVWPRGHSHRKAPPPPPPSTLPDRRAKRAAWLAQLTRGGNISGSGYG